MRLFELFIDYVLGAYGGLMLCYSVFLTLVLDNVYGFVLHSHLVGMR